MPSVRLSHIGICVSELSASERFYCDALGFERRSELEVSGEACERLLALRPTELHAVYLERDGVAIELLCFHRPGHQGSSEPRPMNALGLTHLSLRVTDVDDTLEAIRRCGGRVLEETRVDNPAFSAIAIFAADPDGTRIELVQSPTPLDELPGSQTA